MNENEKISDSYSKSEPTYIGTFFANNTPIFYSKTFLKNLNNRLEKIRVAFGIKKVGKKTRDCVKEFETLDAMDREVFGIQTVTRKSGAVVKTVKHWEMTKQAAIINDLLIGIYSAYTLKKKDNEKERFDLSWSAATNKVSQIEVTAPLSSFRKWLYGAAFVDNKGKFKHGYANILREYVDNDFLEIIRADKPEPRFLQYHTDKNIISIKKPIVFNGFNSDGLVSASIDADFFALKVVVKDKKPQYAKASGRYIPMLSGLYSHLIVGKHLNSEKGISALTAYEICSALQLASNNQSITGIKRLHVENTYTRLLVESQFLQNVFAHDNQARGYFDYDDIANAINTASNYLYQAIDKTNTLISIIRQSQSQRIFLPKIAIPRNQNQGLVVMCEKASEISK